MEEIVKLIKNGVVQYPITKPEAVIDETGLSLVQKLEEKANKTEIPTKVSQLENDAEYATKSEIDGKQDEIKDLDAIRSGAAKGATALQSIPAEYVTDDELDNALRPKVNVNQIATINGKSLVNGGNIVITGGEGGGYDDTEIRAELDELSAEVSGLSERVDELEQPIFEAKYGETTYDEIVAAKNEGKWVILIKDRLTYHLSYVAESLAYFATINNNNSYSIYINKATNGWVEGVKTLEETKNKTTTISESSTDTQYPSAKAVYDALQNVGGGGGGTDTKLREAVFGKVTSKEFAINGYHASTADTFAVDIKQGEVFHLKLETLGAEITKYQLYVKYEGDAEQTSLLYFAPNEDYSFFAERPIVEFGVNTSSGWVTTKGNAKFSITQGGMTQPYNYMQLGVITIAENISELNVLDYIPLLLKFKNVKVYCHFTYSAERTKSGAIKLNKENSCSISLDGLFGSATSTAYILDITLDKNSIKAYIECHSNSFGNPQLSDGNQGKNFGKLALGNPIDTFIINLPLLAGDKLTFYGK